MFEHRSEPILTRELFLQRLVRHGGIALTLVVLSLIAGTAGFCYFADESWIDGFLNSAMLLSGMGLVGEIDSTGGKLFASLFALYGGIVFVAASAIVLIPLLHRWLHKFHLNK